MKKLFTFLAVSLIAITASARQRDCAGIGILRMYMESESASAGDAWVSAQDTIRLTADITVESDDAAAIDWLVEKEGLIKVYGQKRLDLNGHTLHYTYNDKPTGVIALFQLMTYGRLTIMDSKGGGKILFEVLGYLPNTFPAAVYIKNGSHHNNITLQSGRLEGKVSWGGRLEHCGIFIDSKEKPDGGLNGTSWSNVVQIFGGSVNRINIQYDESLQKFLYYGIYMYGGEIEQGIIGWKGTGAGALNLDGGNFKFYGGTINGFNAKATVENLKANNTV